MKLLNNFADLSYNYKVLPLVDKAISVKFSFAFSFV